jgi:hypothetical protein
MKTLLHLPLTDGGAVIPGWPKRQSRAAGCGQRRRSVRVPHEQNAYIMDQKLNNRNLPALTT